MIKVQVKYNHEIKLNLGIILILCNHWKRNGSDLRWQSLVWTLGKVKSVVSSHM